MEDFNLEKTNVPHCLVVNNYENFSIYPYYNSIISEDKYMVRMPYLDHNGFISYWNFFNACSSHKSVSQFCDSYDSICDVALLFFNEYLQAGASSNTKLSFQTNEYVQPKSIDNSMVMQLCNSILAHGMETAMIFLTKNQEVFKSKENEINIMSKMFSDNDISTSIQLLTFNTTNHPDSWQAYFDLGIAYKEKGDLSLSKQSLLKAQELNPDNGAIAKMLDEISEL
jgi:tetratricopeptide (TPR) repeat protein